MSEFLERLPALLQDKTRREQLNVLYRDGIDVYTIPNAPVTRIHNVFDTDVSYTEGTDYRLLEEFRTAETFNAGQNTYQIDTDMVQDGITRVTGTLNGEEHVFEEAVDFDEIDTGSGSDDGIDWNIGGDSPDDGTEFVVTYRSTDYDDPYYIDWGIGGSNPPDGTEFIVDATFETIISRYTAAYDEAFDFYDEEITETIKTHEVDNASGEELDQLGKLFGKLGRRRGRSDPSYRVFLKSVVESFSGRGTVSGIKFAVGAAANLDPSNVGIEEDFSNLEYCIILSNWTQHNVNALYEIAELADPSAVELAVVKYNVPDEETITDDDYCDIVVATNTALSLWDEEDYDEFSWDGDGPGDITESDDTAEDSVTVEPSSLQRWDSDDYNTFNWDDELPAHRSLSSDSVNVLVRTSQWNADDWGAASTWTAINYDTSATGYYGDDYGTSYGN